MANTLRSTAGTEGMKFFPLVFSLFIFVLTVNLLGLLPYGFTVTSHIVITVALTALEVLVAVLQAYVFATLTSIYLNDALHPGH